MSLLWSSLKEEMENRFYVYIQRRKDNNEVFYVGKGQRLRLLSHYGRSNKWKCTVKDACGFIYEKLHDNLTEDEAISIENNYIDTPLEDWNLINVMGSTVVNRIIYNDISEYLYYDETSKTCLRWKKKPAPVIIVGDEAGCKGGNRFLVRFQEKLLQAHRVVMVLNGIDVHGKLVDHIDGNPMNNKLSNLRVVTASENSKNLSLSKRNTTGVIGVRYAQEDNRYIAQWYGLSGECKSKSFACKKYGETEAFRLACEYRKQMIAELNQQGAGYTERHGT